MAWWNRVKLIPAPPRFPRAPSAETILNYEIVICARRPTLVNPGLGESKPPFLSGRASDLGRAHGHLWYSSQLHKATGEGYLAHDHGVARHSGLITKLGHEEMPGTAGWIVKTSSYGIVPLKQFSPRHA